MAKAKFIRQIIGVIPTTLLLAFSLYVVSASIFAVSSAEESSTSTEVHVSVSNPSDSQTSALGYFIRLVSETAVDMSILPTRDGEIGVVADNVYAWTNSPTGYKLYLSSATDSNKLYLDGDETSAHYFSPTTTSTLDNNSWGYGLNATSFAAVPVKDAETLLRGTQEANQYAAMDDALTKTPVYYGAKAGYELPAGNYTGTVLYTALAEATESLSPGITVSPSTLKNFAGGETLTISTTLFTNIEDAGDVTVKVGNDICAVTSVETGYDAADGTLTIRCVLPAKPALQKSYDVYVAVPKFGKSYTLADGITYEFENKLASVSTMQGLTEALCAATTTPAAFNEDSTINADVPQGTLYDVRDGESYVVRKLADGNCWMSENLRLNLSTSTTLTPTNTDIANNWTPSDSTQLSTGITWAQNGSDGARSYNSGNRNYGVMYNWIAATAGSGNYMDGTEEKAEYSICPKNWSLPDEVLGKKSFGRLAGIYSIQTVGSGESEYQKIISSPFSLTLAGDYYPWDGILRDSGHDGRLWTNQAYFVDGNSGAQTILINDGTSGVAADAGRRFHTYYGGYKGEGLSVRCLVYANN